MKTDKEKFIEFLKNSNIEFEEWNQQLLILDSGFVRVHFNSKGKLTDIIGGGESNEG